MLDPNQAVAQAADKAASGASSFWEAAPSLGWLLLVIVLLVIFGRGIRELLRELAWKIKAGSSVKIASFELGSSYVSPADFSVASKVIHSRVDESQERYKQRKVYYEPNRKIMLVHRITPSKQRGQLYDILIYVIPHKGATLSCVDRVEYYFGKHWGNKIFTSIDRAQNFMISTSAYGAFMCTAELHFSDGEKAMVSRYIDFEMGGIAAARGETN